MYAQTYNVFPFTVVYIGPSKELEEIIEQVGYCFNSFSIYNLHVKMLINNSLYHSGFLFLNVWYEESPIARQENVHTLQTNSTLTSSQQIVYKNLLQWLWLAKFSKAEF